MSPSDVNPPPLSSVPTTTSFCGLLEAELRCGMDLGCGRAWVWLDKQHGGGGGGRNTIGTAYAESEKASLNFTDVTIGSSAVSPTDVKPRLLPSYLWASGSRTAMRNGPWMWQGVGVVGRAAWEQHRYSCIR